MGSHIKSPVLLLSLLLILNFSSLAQQIAGEKVPDLKFNGLINSPSPSVRFSDFKGKLIILDFWAFNCANCIEAFPQFEVLQKKLGDKIQILLVNHESKKETIEFFAKRKKQFQRPNLLFITGDTILRKMFRKDYIPWEIWIDGEQRFQFATDGSDVTEDKINAFLSKGEFAGTQLIPHPDYNKRIPLFEQTNKEYLKSIQFISYISKDNGLNLFGMGFYSYQPGKMRLVRGATNSIEELIISAFSEDYSLYDFVRNNVSLEVSDTLKFRRPVNNPGQTDSWIRNFSYNYDCILPESNAKQAYEIMRQTLISFFNVNVTIEKRKAKSLALVRTGKDDKLLSKGINKKLPMDTFYTRYNYPFKDFAGDMKIIFRGFSLPGSIIDETGYKENIDIVGLNTSPLKEKDISAFRIELQKFGLDLIEKEYLQDILIIKDKLNTE